MNMEWRGVCRTHFKKMPLMKVFPSPALVVLVVWIHKFICRAPVSIAKPCHRQDALCQIRRLPSRRFGKLDTFSKCPQSRGRYSKTSEKVVKPESTINRSF